MTLEQDQVAELFGLAGTFPRPAWVVLDAARDHRFTGELVFDLSPETHVYLDRGRIYLAERSTDPSLGTRLVDAGALNAVELEHGSMRIGEVAHLGRLFERVPSVDRETAMLTTELMNEACVAWLAGRQVHAVTSTPYRHHPSGIHRWDRPADAIDLNPGDPLPAPPPTQSPVQTDPPAPAHPALSPEPTGSDFSDFSEEADPVIHWDEPSWLDHQFTADEPEEPTTSPLPSVPAPSHRPDDDPMLLSSDWADRLELDGLPQAGSDPLAPKATLPPIAVEPPDRFEIIWPSGEIDAGFPSLTPSDAVGDQDRRGPTARLGRSVNIRPEPAADPDDSELWDFESTGPSYGPVDDPTSSRTSSLVSDAEESATNDLALSMRRAVASIETGSLAARQRLSEAAQLETSGGPALSVPGRVATRSDSSLWGTSRAQVDTARSVFDDPSTTRSVEHQSDTMPATADAQEAAPEPARASALRRLIGGLRRR